MDKVMVNPIGPKYHRDGSVTVWDVYAQRWRRIYPGDQTRDSIQTIAALAPDVKERVIARLGLDDPDQQA